MKINSVEIEILQADIRKVRVDVVVVEAGDKPAVKACKVVKVKSAAQARSKYLIYAALRGKDGSIPEENVRGACFNALKSASSLGVESIAFSALGCGGDGFSCLASAKIMAQEFFRYARSSRRALKNIKIILSSKEDYKIFKDTVYGYLTHILHKISEGPFVTVDIVIETGGGIVLIERSNPPFGWALPGGFVDYGESLEDAAAREAKEETSLAVKNLKQMRTYSEPTRDPRFHTVSTVFIAQGEGKLQAASDASAAQVFRIGEWNNIPLAFDHRKILDDYLRLKKTRG